jgi:hypothetical protein
VESKSEGGGVFAVLFYFTPKIESEIILDKYKGYVDYVYDDDHLISTRRTTDGDA